MRKTKKIFITITLVFLFIIFNSFPNMAKGKIQDGKIEINNGLLNLEKFFNEYQRIAPSQIVSSKKVVIKNTGNLPIKMYQKFSFSLKSDGTSKMDLENMLQKYLVKIHILENGKELYVEQLSGHWTPASKFNEIFSSEKGKEIDEISPRKNLTIVLDIKLDERAGNEYQGILFNVDLFTTGLMVITKNGFSLPVTASNQFNFLFGGIVLIALGGYLYFKRRNKIKLL
jgi:LPXTG-motif cell wall-anchored protein